MIVNLILAATSASSVSTGPSTELTELHRYWRMSINDDGYGNGYVWATELEIRAYQDSANIAGMTSTKTATDDDNTYPFTNLFDGDTNTLARTDNSAPTYPVLWTFDFGPGGAVQISEIVVTPGFGNADEAPHEFDVQFSDDGVNWTTFWSVSGTPMLTTADPVTFTAPDAPVDPTPNALRAAASEMYLVTAPYPAGTLRAAQSDLYLVIME